MTYVHDNINSFLPGYVCLTTNTRNKYSNFSPHFETGLCRIYEEYLRDRNPSAKTIEYKIGDLINFIDVIPEITCMVFRKRTGHYAPYGKDWIKDQVYEKFKREMSKDG